MEQERLHYSTEAEQEAVMRPVRCEHGEMEGRFNILSYNELPAGLTVTLLQPRAEAHLDLFNFKIISCNLVTHFDGERLELIRILTNELR